jgi:hypothetical protein
MVIDMKVMSQAQVIGIARIHGPHGSSASSISLSTNQPNYSL